MTHLPSSLALLCTLYTPGQDSPAAVQRPTVTIQSPAPGYATNAASLTVMALIAPPQTKGRSIGNVTSVDFLVNDQVVETIDYQPPLHAAVTHSFTLSLLDYGDQVLRIDARAYMADRTAGIYGTAPTVSMIVDRTAPSISLQWPPDDPFSTDRSTVLVEGTALDDLAGIDAVSLDENGMTTVLDEPAFSVERALDTFLPPGATANEHAFRLTAVDRAGNEAHREFRVYYTLQAAMPFVDASAITVVDGTVVSRRHAFLVFNLQLTPAERHAFVESYGGRVSGYLPLLNTALVEFCDCDSVDGLLDRLTRIMTDHGPAPEVDDNIVTGAQLYCPLEPTQASGGSSVVPGATEVCDDRVDNDGDGLVDGADPFCIPLDNDTILEDLAYRDIRSDDAIRYIAESVPAAATRPVTVAILDTGLDHSYGMDNELEGMGLIDMAPGMGLVYSSPMPISYSDSDIYGHGTWCASTVAGKNNDVGNNGVALIENGGPQVQVIAYKVFRFHWLQNIPWVPDDKPWADPGRLALACEDLIGRGVDVANMSFGSRGSPLFDGWDRDLFRRIFSRGGDTFWVIAAGNDGVEVDRDIECDIFCNLVLPTVVSSEYTNVIAVAGHVPLDGERCDYVDGGSNYDNTNESIQISAPGCGVWAAIAEQSYGYWGGTSAAAPLVAGAAALIRAVSPVTAGDIKDILVASARPPIANNPHPRLDVLAAVQLSQDLAGSVHVGGRDGGGDDSASWGGAFARTPALNGFSFEFVDGDHHIDIVNIDASASSVAVRFEDRNADDDYVWWVEGAPLPAATIYGRYPLAGTIEDQGGCDTSPALPESGLGVFVLTGFWFNYIGDDHHIDRIRVHFYDDVDGTHIGVCYDDKNGDDDYTWQVEYAVVPFTSVASLGSSGPRFVDPIESETTESLDLGVTLAPGAQPVIRGFGFDLETNDQHLKRLQVDISSLGTAHVKFRDERAGSLFDSLGFGRNDEYTWFLDWAVVAPCLPETCNGVDDDCDGLVDEDALDALHLWPDADGDGFGDATAQPALSCTPLAGHVENALDCNDGDPSVFPGATEVCDDGVDDDCDGLVDAADPDCSTTSVLPKGKLPRAKGSRRP